MATVTPVNHLPAASLSGVSSQDNSQLVSQALALIESLLNEIQQQQTGQSGQSGNSKGSGGSSGSNGSSNAQQEGQQLAQDLMNPSTQSAAGAGNVSSGDWLEAIAAALGKAMGNVANQMQADAQNVGSSNASTSTQATADLQAQSQTFGLLSNALNTVLTSAGQGLQTLAKGNA